MIRRQIRTEAQMLRIATKLRHSAPGSLALRLGRAASFQLWAMIVRSCACALTMTFGCASALPAPTVADLAQARADDPSTVLADLQRGHDAYAHHCGGCHALRSPGERSPDEWPVEVARMQSVHKVQLSTAEARDIVRYLRATSARERGATMQ
jgi:mono/diheme cytochrome c family protein